MQPYETHLSTRDAGTNCDQLDHLILSPLASGSAGSEVLGFQSEHRVSTFRCAKMSGELQANLARRRALGERSQE